MFLDKLSLKDFGKFNNKEIELKPGLNLIYGTNESGKTTIKEFIVGMLYGIEKSRGLGARLDDYELRKPFDGRGFSGRAYIKDKGKNYFVERSFLRHNRKVSVMDVQSGLEVRLKNKNSLHGTIFELDKNTYVNTLCIGEHGAAPGKELAGEMNNYLVNLSTTGSADIDKDKAIERLKQIKKQYDTRSVAKKVEIVSNELVEFDNIDEQIKDVRKQISELEQEFAMETAKRKREARKLIEQQKISLEENAEEENTEAKKAEIENRETGVTQKATEGDAEVVDEAKHTEQTSEAEKEADVEQDSEKVDSVAKKSEADKSDDDEEASEKKKRLFLDADLIKDIKKDVPLTDRVWFIILTGLFVIGVIAAMVYILPFERSVRQLFIVCTVLFVIVTIVEGMYAKGMFDGDVYAPDEEDFKRVIYEMERKQEAFQDVEIDMSFAAEYADKKAELRIVEKELLDKKEKRSELEEEFNVMSKELERLERENHIINLAINTINQVSAEIHGDLGFLINDNISDIVSKITDGKYQDVRLDENLHVMVRDNDSYVGMEYLSAGTMEQIYLAVRLSVARLLCRDKMPLIIDDIFTSYDETRLVNTLDCLKTIDTEQIILLTSNPHIGDMLDDLDMDYNYVEL